MDSFDKKIFLKLYADNISYHNTMKSDLFE